MKKILAMVVACAMLFTLLSVPAFAEEAVVDVTSPSVYDGVSIDTSWYNTTDTEFTINSAAQFAGFAAIANGTAEGIAMDTFAGKTVKLGVDIDLNNHKWAPIGGRTSATLAGAIECTFDGQNHTISNLKVEKGSEYEAVNMNIGLFGITRTGKFVAKNFTLKNVDIYGSASVAAVLGRTVNCKAVIDNVDVIGNIKIEASTQNVGAICAQGYVPVVTNCNVIGSDGSYIKANWQVGGIVGWSGESANATNVADCSVENVTISGRSYVSAIAAIVQYGASIKNNTAKNVTLNIVEEENNEYYYGTIIGCTGAGYVDGKGKNTLPVYISGNTTEAVNVILNGEAVAAPVEFGAHYEGTSYVSARIGDAYYENLQVAIDAAQDGETIEFLRDITQELGVKITDKNLTIDLKGYTFTVTKGDDSTEYRNFLIDGDSVVTIKNGTIISEGETEGVTSSGVWGSVRTQGTANVTLTDLKLYNYRGNGLNVKACSGTNVAISDTEIYAQYGGGVESAGGTVTLDNVKVDQKGMWKAPYNSMAISVNGGGKVTVNSGTYTTMCLTAEEANAQGTSHGPWTVGVLNSGGTLIINGGTFSNDNYGENNLATYARGMVLADTGAKIEIKGGTFTALKGVVDYTNNLGDASKNPVVTIKGGTYSADPTSSWVSLPLGYKLLTGTDGKFTVVEDSLWTTDTDAGYYLVDETPYGFMRFLFAADVAAEDITASGIKYVKASNISENVTGSGADGTTVNAGAGANAFFGDVNGIPQGTTGDYYAVAYITTKDGTVWSDFVKCSPNFNKLFTNYNGGANE